MNRYPYNSGHVMVIPYAHGHDPVALAQDHFDDLHAELRLATSVVREVYKPEGFNIGLNLGQCAGAGIVDHLHYHIVPRWNGDTNFMPVLAETKAIVEHLETAWDRIQAAFKEAR